MNKWLEKSQLAIISVIFTLIVVHAPIMVFFGGHFPQYDLLIKSWKEILMIIGAGLLIIDMTRQSRWRTLTKDWLFWTILGYAGLHLLLLPLFPIDVKSTLSGFAIDLRYLLFFALVYGYLKLYPRHAQRFLRTIVIGACIVVGFALVQQILPRDFLTVLGYGQGTIQPYLLVDENHDLVRANSTLRGPNPLGAYASIVLVGVVAAGAKYGRRNSFSVSKRWMHAFLAIASIVALYVSYSRSAWLAGVVGMGIVLVVNYGRRIPKWSWGLIVLTCVVAIVGVLALKDNHMVSKLVFHEDPLEAGVVNSNDGHAESLIEGTRRMLYQPLGAGVGSTGSASLFGSDPIIIENQYLFIAHETGWVGLILFVVIYLAVLYRLWQQRSSWLALAAFASGIGLGLVGLLLPVWVDDTVSIVWWGLAAIILVMKEDYGKTKQKTA